MIKKAHIKIFFLTFFAVFLMVVLSHAGEMVKDLISPLAHKDDVFETVIRPKIEYKENSYKLNKPAEIVGKAHAGESIDDASAYAVADFDTGTILEAKNPDQQLPMASLTKIMTAVVALDLADPSETFSVTDGAASQIPTKIGVTPGDKLTLDELLNATMLTSANDATEVIREGIDKKYGQEVFIRAMNEKAAYLGLENTHFTNPQGFDNPYHYSSAQDLLVLTHYALTNYPLISEIVKKDEVVLSQNDMHGRFRLYNWNGLIGVYPGAFGVKIGNTGRAGRTTIVASEREGKRMMAAVLNAPDIKKRDMWASRLLDVGFEEGYGLTPIDISEDQLTKKYRTWVY